jgi:peptidoglycan/xylan/chitin deacetylase (PgdA/CDA1 family)
MKKVSCYFLFALSLLVTSVTYAREIVLTFDDAPTPDSALMTGQERTKRLIDALTAAKVPDALFFVKAGHINGDTKKRLNQYVAAGFHLANHSYSHKSASELGTLDYPADVYKAHLLLKPFGNVLPYHRFPYLHYGKDLPAIVSLQQSLTDLGYKDGYVTVDNFDWYISSLLTKAAEEKKTIDYGKARKFYVETLYQSIEFYDAIAQKSLGRSPQHVLLLHENDAAALFVGDLIAHLRAKGWKIISPQQAYQDPIARNFPNITFHKQGRVAAIANSKGVPESELRHPSENTEYLDRAFADAKVVLNK